LDGVQVTATRCCHQGRAGLRSPERIDVSTSQKGE